MIREFAEIFCWKNVSSFCSAKATHIFSAKNIRILCIESAKTVKEMTLNELVKLTTLWTTGPRIFKLFSLRKQAYTNILKILPLKKENFLLKNIDCWYSLELPQWGGSNEYPQSMFLSRNKNKRLNEPKPHTWTTSKSLSGNSSPISWLDLWVSQQYYMFWVFSWTHLQKRFRWKRWIHTVY